MGIGFVVLQPFMYGQSTDLDFMCRSLTLVGSLFLLLRHEEKLTTNKKTDAFAGLPSNVMQSMGSARLQLAGRILLMFIFFFQAFHHLNKESSWFNIISLVVLMALSILVIVGFKARWSALLLVLLLGVTNVSLYPFWSVNERLRDFYKYYFFQTLSVMGGLLLLVLYGPGGLSMDQGAKKMM